MTKGVFGLKMHHKENPKHTLCLQKIVKIPGLNTGWPLETFLQYSPSFFGFVAYELRLFLNIIIAIKMTTTVAITIGITRRPMAGEV